LLHPACNPRQLNKIKTAVNANTKFLIIELNKIIIL
jgi:hypothetical protein